MEKANKFKKAWIDRIVLAVLFSLMGSVIIIVFSPYRPLLPDVFDFWGRIVLMMLLLVSALLTRESDVFQQYWQLIFGLFIMISAVSFDYWSARFVLDYLGGYPATPLGLVLEKLKTVVIVSLVVIILTRVSGTKLGSIFIQKGKLKLGLIIGGITFAIAVAGSIPMSTLMFAGKSVKVAEVLKWAPWILIIVFANASTEELLFRGLFLKKLEPFYGKFFSNCLVAFVFTGLHLGVSYTRDQMLFLIVVVPLALAWGFIMQKTESLWGSILFHAGADIPIFIAIFSTRF